MATDAQKQLKTLIGTLKWADEMFKNSFTSGDVDIEGITAETARVLEARRADVLCSTKDEHGKRCMLSRAHVTQRVPSPHHFDERP